MASCASDLPRDEWTVGSGDVQVDLRVDMAGSDATADVAAVGDAAVDDVDPSGDLPSVEDAEAGDLPDAPDVAADGPPACVPADETCDGLDNDCDGGTDEATCDDGNPCTVDTCAGAAGCTYVPADGAACDDGNACTVGDLCKYGQCKPGPVLCDDGNVCTSDSCDPKSGCVHADAGAACDDGYPCSIDACDAVKGCGYGGQVDCDDDNACTDDACDPKIGCVNALRTGSCDDGNVCTLSDTCKDGQCGPLVLPGCPKTGNPCIKGCAGDSTPCTEFFYACPQTGEICVDTPKLLNCDDKNACTTDSCDKVAGCVHAPIAGCK